MGDEGEKQREYEQVFELLAKLIQCNMHFGTSKALITSFKRQVERETFNKVLEYQRMRICMADKSRCVEVLAGNVVKEAMENGAIAELRGLETWVREQQAKEGS